ncbi:MAG: c-type cytochrome [Gemmatimonadota bacterium]|nr:c-type cytochrome [Gemmatimonadota bacterium]
MMRIALPLSCDTRVAAACLAVALSAVALMPTSVAAQVDGEALYVKWCAGCHGEDGTGNGVAANTMLPRPRDFTLALYQVRTTATGELPTDADILKVIDEGMPGSTMPGWEDVLTQQERLALVDHLKTFSRFFQGDAPEQLEFSSATRGTDEAIASGQEVYQSVECWRCHGQQGRGDGESAPTLEDDTGFPIFAADLTENWTFNGGGTVEEIYRVLRTGLDGTPMPTFADIVDAGVITDEQLWGLAHYVRSLSPEETPEVREVVSARRITDGTVPETVGDEAWEAVEPIYVPLVGQIVVKPRWFNPRVGGVWVQALHDGQELALLVSWTDPSLSPDPTWTDFAQRIIEIMGPGDEGAATAPGAPDQLVVQFPTALSDGMERPYFLQGDARRPTNTWTWRSDAPDAVEGIARGLGTAVPQPDGEQHVTAVVQHSEGEWKVLFRRSLDTGGAEDLVLPVGQAVPMAFQAWDGDNGESGNQGAVSTWYFLFLEQPTPVSVYVAPPIVLVLTLLFGLLVIRQAQWEASGAGAGAALRLPRFRLTKAVERAFGMGVGLAWLGMAAAAYRSASLGWAAGHSDLGFWWTVIAALMAIAGLGAMIGTFIHTRPRDEGR